MKILLMTLVSFVIVVSLVYFTKEKSPRIVYSEPIVFEKQENSSGDIAKAKVYYWFDSLCQLHYEIFSKEPNSLKDEMLDTYVKRHAIVNERNYFYTKERYAEYQRAAVEAIPDWNKKIMDSNIKRESVFTESETAVLKDLQDRLEKKYEGNNDEPAYASDYKLGPVFDGRQLRCLFNDGGTLLGSEYYEKKGARIGLAGDLSTIAKRRFHINIYLSLSEEKINR